MPNNYDRAMAYLAQGWMPIPLCRPTPLGCSASWHQHGDDGREGKRALVRWRHLETVTEDDVREWWTQWPTANIGILTGRRSGGLVVVDEDPGGMESLVAAGFVIPQTYRVQTGRGFQHYAHCGRPIKTIGGGDIGLPGIDIRGEGGYVVAPPSLHRNGNTYTLVDDLALADGPLWLPDHEEPRRSSPQAVRPKRRASTPTDAVYEGTFPALPRTVVALAVDPADQESDISVRQADRATYRDRSDAAFSVLLSLVQHHGWDDDTIVRWFTAHCTLWAHYDDESDLRRDIANAHRHVAENPPRWLNSLDSIALADLHITAPGTRRTLRAFQSVAQAQGEGRFTAARADVQGEAGYDGRSSVNYQRDKLVETGWLEVVFRPAPGQRLAPSYVLSLPMGLTLDDPALLELEQSIKRSRRSLAGASSTPTSPVVVCVGGVEKVNVMETSAGTTDVPVNHDALARGSALRKTLITLRHLTVSTPRSADELQARTRKTRATLKGHLRELVKAGIALDSPAGYLLTPNVLEALDDYATTHGLAGAGARRQQAIYLDRHANHVQQVIHARESGGAHPDPDREYEGLEIVAADTGEVLKVLRKTPGDHDPNEPDPDDYEPTVLMDLSQVDFPAKGLAGVDVLDRYFEDGRMHRVVTRRSKQPGLLRVASS